MRGKQQQNTQSREQKRALFRAAGGRSGTRKLTAIIVFGVAALVVYAAFSSSPSSEPATTAVVQSSQSQQTSAGSQSAGAVRETAGHETAEKEIAVPVADLKDGRAKFFKYTAMDQKEMRFFAIRSSDGVYRAALDACDVCYREKRGYVQDGDDMVCRKCGQRFHSALVNEVTGGCNPVAIAREVAGDKIIIKTSELESRKAFF